MLKKEERVYLLNLALEAIKLAVNGKEVAYPPLIKVPPHLRECLGGMFVTIHEHDKLRGCIGTFVDTIPAYILVMEMAKEAAIHDYRFSPVSREEVDHLDVEVSVLSKMSPIKSIEEVKTGIHGLYVSYKDYTGVLLPQVATEHHLDREGFIKAVYQKAGLSEVIEPEKHLKLFTAEIFNSEGELC